MRTTLSSFELPGLLRQEFGAYTRGTLQRDILAGLTVGAVALPLALAFGVASGATPAAGLITAIISGLVIGGLGGSRFQISGPTGAMSAILIGLAGRYGLAGIWVAGLLAGAILIALGLFRLGRYIAFIPSPVITGFTSGIALIIAIGQLDNVLGVKTAPAENTLHKLGGYLAHPIAPDWRAVAVAAIVVLTMLITPKISARIPGSLAGLILATLATTLAGWNIPVIGAIPSSLILDQRLSLAQIPWGSLDDLVGPALAIAALGAIETLLCGAVAGTMTGHPMDNNQELIGQGIGNMLLPFLGGVPATAAIARTSVGIKSGGVTRMVSFVHAGVLLLAVFALGDVIGRVPLAALGGVLIVTAWRMNEWEKIRFFVHKRVRHAISAMLVTMVATIALDLTQAIMLGIAISAISYLRQSASAAGVIEEGVSLDKVRGRGYPLQRACPDIRIYYLTGPLFFGTVGSIMALMEETHQQYRTLVISMRGVPLVDVMGAEALRDLIERQRARGGDVLLTSIQPAARRMLVRTGVIVLQGRHNIFWNAVEATVVAHGRHAQTGCQHCLGLEPLAVDDEPRVVGAQDHGVPSHAGLTHRQVPGTEEVLI